MSQLNPRQRFVFYMCLLIVAAFCVWVGFRVYNTVQDHERAAPAAAAAPQP